MLNAEKRALLSKANDWPACKADLSGELHKAFTVAYGYYDFATAGGAVGDYNLVGSNGLSVVLPSGALVLNAIAFVETAVTSGGLLTLDLNIESANDLLAATAVASLTLSAKIQGIPDFGTLADSVLLTADRTLTASLNVAAATAGKFHVFVFYVHAKG